MTAPFRTRQPANCLETASPTFAEGNDNMATAAQLDLAPETGTDIAVVVAKNPGVVLVDTAKFDAFYEKLKADAAAIQVDLTTKKGREALASFAAKVRSEKAAIDKDRLRLTKEWRDLTAQVNGAWKGIEERLNGLAVEVRAPLTAWEEAEKARVEHCRAITEGLKAMARVDMDDTASVIRERGSVAWNTVLDAEQFGDMLAEAEAAKEHAVTTLKAAFVRLQKEESDRAELDRLRAENEARAERERAEAEARAQAEREAEEARIAEERRVAAEKAEAERLAQIERDAAERAKREAEQAAEAERQRIEREHAEQLAAERRRAEEAERAAQAERDRIAADEAARAAEAKRIADEQAKREADQAHRTAVKSKAKNALMTCGADEETARKIVVAILAGEIPGVTLGF